jgi:hypothetical protein
MLHDVVWQIITNVAEEPLSSNFKVEYYYILEIDPTSDEQDTIKRLLCWFPWNTIPGLREDYQGPNWVGFQSVVVLITTDNGKSNCKKRING